MTVYPVNSQTSGAISTVDGVKVVAHPDDLAAGRRPRVHVQGTVFARYADELNAGHWEVHQALGGVHGTVWRTVQVVGTNKINVGVSYRARIGPDQTHLCLPQHARHAGSLGPH